MKTSLYLLILLLAMACTSRQGRIESKVSAYAREHLGEPSSYESVSFKIDSVKVFDKNSPEFKQAVDAFVAKSEGISREELVEGVLQAQAGGAAYLASKAQNMVLSNLLQGQASKEMLIYSFIMQAGFDGKKIPLRHGGYQVLHEYRGKNEYNATVLKRSTFVVDLEGNVQNMLELK